MVLATALCLFGACGDKHVDQELPGSARHVVVEGPWKDGARIPVKYTCDGRNVRPNVGAWAPKGAREEAIVMTDPDAPGGTFVHWTHWGRSTDGRNSFGKTGYSGPCPPKGDKPHHYVITLYLLPSLNQKLIPKLNKELKPGTRVVSQSFDMGAQNPPLRTIDVNGRAVYLWKTPLKEQ